MPRRKLDGRYDVQQIFRVNSEIKAQIDEIADRMHMTTSDWIRMAIMEKLAESESAQTQKTPADRLASVGIDIDMLDDLIVSRVLDLRKKGLL